MISLHDIEIILLGLDLYETRLFPGRDQKEGDYDQPDGQVGQGEFSSLREVSKQYEGNVEDIVGKK